MWEFILSLHGYWHIAILFTLPFWGAFVVCLLSLFVEQNLVYICERPFKIPAFIKVMYNWFEKKDKQKENLTTDDVAGMCAVYVFLPPIAFCIWPITGFVLAYFLMLKTLRFMVRIKKGLTKLITNKKCLKDYTDDDVPNMRF